MEELMEMSEKDILAAELLCGYKYWSLNDKGEALISNLEKENNQMIRKIDSLNDDIRNNQNRKSEHEENCIKYANYDSCSEARKDYEEYKQIQNDRINNELAELKKNKFKIMLPEITYIVLILVGFLLAISAFICLLGLDYGFIQLDLDIVWKVLIVGGGGIVGIAFVIVFSKLYNDGHGKYKNQVKQLEKSRSLTYTSVTAYVNAKYSRNKKANLLAEELKRNAENFDKNEKELEEKISTARLKIEQNKAKINKTKQLCQKTRKEIENIKSNLQVVPVAYFRSEPIKYMLVFFINKRADNITDLINMYENEKFREQALKYFSAISVGINNLTSSINNGFSRLGLQLGVINSNIQGNTNAMLLNNEKLQQIEDSNTRHYLETISQIHRVEDSVKEYSSITNNINANVDVTVY